MVTIHTTLTVFLTVTLIRIGDMLTFGSWQNIFMEVYLEH